MGTVAELRVALTVGDFEQALAFYRDALGLEQIADWSGQQGRVIILDAVRATLELLASDQAAYVDGIEAGARVAGHVRLAMGVADSGEMSSRLVAAGADSMAALVETPWGDRNIRLRSPDGLQLTLFSSGHAG